MSWTITILWTLLIVVSTLSFLNIFLFLRLLKKHDELQSNVVQIFEYLKSQYDTLYKTIELLKKRSRIIGNEVKSNKQDRKNQPD